MVPGRNGLGEILEQGSAPRGVVLVGKVESGITCCEGVDCCEGITDHL